VRPGCAWYVASSPDAEAVEPSRDARPDGRRCIRQLAAAPRRSAQRRTSRPLSDLGDLDPSVANSIILDFDDRGRLVGIEVLGAARVLHPELLAQAEH
jgi:hypothetical protein